MHAELPSKKVPTSAAWELSFRPQDVQVKVSISSASFAGAGRRSDVFSQVDGDLGVIVQLLFLVKNTSLTAFVLWVPQLGLSLAVRGAVGE